MSATHISSSRAFVRSSVRSQISWIAFGACAIALSAQIKFLIPGTPVPATLQTFAVLVLGGLLGARAGVAATGLYLMGGMLGAPWFAALTLGPTLGYLLGFVLAAAWMGYAVHRLGARSLSRLWAHAFLGQLLIYATGLVVLSYYMGVTGAFLSGVIPFVAADLLKVTAASLVLRIFVKAT